MAKTFLNEGDTVEIQGSGKNPYKVRKIGGVVDCSCPAWRNLGGPIDIRVCKHIRANIDPLCLLPQAQAVLAGVAPGSITAAVAGPVTVSNNPPSAATSSPTPRLTKTGKISTAVGGAVVKSTAPPILLAHTWDSEDPTGWYMSEKFDGVRAWWDGEKFVSRLGNTYYAPEWFKALLPKDDILDGELWIGRGKFQETISVVKKLIPTDSEWQNVTYVMFDAPKVNGMFHDRLRHLQSKFPTMRVNDGGGLGQVVVAEQIRCISEDHMVEHLALVEGFGGEGVMLRDPRSLYEEGRSKTCLKVKTFVDDEATVVGYTDGKGKHIDRGGALIVQWKDKEFKVGSGLTDKERENLPAIGARVTFRYCGLTNKGIPKIATYVCERNYE